MSTITVRQLSPAGDAVWGQGQANFLPDLQAVAQIILTRLRLFQGEWWAATNDGLPLWQRILGQTASPQNLQQIELIISERIRGTPYVIGLSNVQVSYNKRTRGPYVYAATVNTQFGQITVTNLPTPPSGAI
jgi:hypothetical protein